jgi:hypothetical protein
VPESFFKYPPHEMRQVCCAYNNLLIAMIFLYNNWLNVRSSRRAFLLLHIIWRI